MLVVSVTVKLVAQYLMYAINVIPAGVDQIAMFLPVQLQIVKLVQLQMFAVHVLQVIRVQRPIVQQFPLAR
jgi:hypothetical protein